MSDIRAHMYTDAYFAAFPDTNTRTTGVLCLSHGTTHALSGIVFVKATGAIGTPYP